MELNQIRLLEACHKYLIDRANVNLKETLSNNKLVFEVNGKLVSFTTYQKAKWHSFYEYELGAYSEVEDHTSIDVTDILSILNLETGIASTLSMITDADQVRNYIFKFLSLVDFSRFEKSIKNTEFVYDFRYLENNICLPCTKIDKDTSFNFIGIV